MSLNLRAVAERVDARLAQSAWDLTALDADAPDVDAAAEVALFALTLSGQRRQARKAGRFSRLVVGFALAACVALATVACEKPDASPEATAQAISGLPTDSSSSVTVSAKPRASPARFNDLVLLDGGSDAQPWAIAIPRGSPNVPILVDRVGAGLTNVGDNYELAAQPVTVGTRDGPSQFLDPLQPATSTGSGDTRGTSGTQLAQRWVQDERYLAVTRAIAGKPTVLDAAYNAEAAAAAGGTHSYVNGVVLRVEPDKPVVQVIDRALLESGRPTRAEDIVYVAIRPDRQALYTPGQVVNLRDVVMDKQSTDVDGQATTVYVANAALNGADVEMTGSSVNLEQLLQPRLQRVDADLAAQQQVAASGTPQPTPLPGTPTSAGQPIIINQNSGYRGPSFVDDFLIFMWLSHSGFYSRGPTVIINNPPSSPSRGGDVYYSAPPAPSGSTPSTVASSQAASRSTALEAARTSISGQSSGTGGGVAATNKSASDATARVSAATSKSASAAGDVATSSVGKSASTAATSSAGTAARSAGSTSAGSRGSVGSSSSSGSKGVGGSSGGFGSSGGKGIGGGSSSSSS